VNKIENKMSFFSSYLATSYNAHKNGSSTMGSQRPLESAAAAHTTAGHEGSAYHYKDNRGNGAVAVCGNGGHQNRNTSIYPQSVDKYSINERDTVLISTLAQLRRNYGPYKRACGVSALNGISDPQLKTRPTTYAGARLAARRNTQSYRPFGTAQSAALSQYILNPAAKDDKKCALVNTTGNASTHFTTYIDGGRSCVTAGTMLRAEFPEPMHPDFYTPADGMAEFPVDFDWASVVTEVPAQEAGVVRPVFVPIEENMAKDARRMYHDIHDFALLSLADCTDNPAKSGLQLPQATEKMCKFLVHHAHSVSPLNLFFTLARGVTTGITVDGMDITNEIKRDINAEALRYGNLVQTTTNPAIVILMVESAYKMLKGRTTMTFDIDGQMHYFYDFGDSLLEAVFGSVLEASSIYTTLNPHPMEALDGANKGEHVYVKVGNN